ncbi:MAG: hypothetical protein Q7K33_03440 [Candidatus Berkelbacteria bacterium]|nr:hypothetical protein [Candidatus Berkelbacteria bacterium]
MLEKDDLKQIGTVVEVIVSRKLVPIEKSLKLLEKHARKTDRDINMIIRTFDSECLGLKERVERLEDKVGIKN